MLKTNLCTCLQRGQAVMAEDNTSGGYFVTSGHVEVSLGDSSNLNEETLFSPPQRFLKMIWVQCYDFKNIFAEKIGYFYSRYCYFIFLSFCDQFKKWREIQIHIGTSSVSLQKFLI
jgi:hypothetical protein